MCAAAGYTRGAFYSQFASLQEPFFACYDEWATKIAEDFGDAVTRALPQHNVVEAIVDNLAVSLDRTWLAFKLDFFLLHASNFPGVAELCGAHRAHPCAVIEDLLSRSGSHCAAVAMRRWPSRLLRPMTASG